MRLSTVWIRNKKTGDKMKINEHDWAGDLGTSRYTGWERVGREQHGEETAKDVAAMRAEAEQQEEKIRAETPASEIASKRDTIAKPAPAVEKEEGLPSKPVAAGTGSRRRGGRR